MATAGKRAVAVALTVAVLLAGCTGDDGGSNDPDGTTQSTGPAGTMRLGIPGDPVVDPAAASLASGTDQMVLDLLYDGLTQLDADGNARPALAAKIVHDKKLVTWTFALAPGVTFSDGTPLTAADVIASIEHVAAAGNGSLQALALEPIAGFRAFVNHKAAHITGLTAPNPQTVRIVTLYPLSTLPLLLASPAYGIVKVSALEAVDGVGDLGGLPLSGTWEVTDTSDDDATLGQREDDGGVGTVILHAYDDVEDAYNALDDGKADWAVVPQAVYDDAVDAYGTDAFAPFQAELFFGMNLASPVFKNAGLRTAIAAAIDRDAIIDAVYKDLADPLATVVPAGVPGHDDTRCSPCDPDVDGATALVKRTYPNGKVPPITIDYDESPAQTQMAAIIADNLKAVGIPTKLHALPLEDYKHFVVSGKQQLFTFGWIGAFTSPDAYLSRLFQSASNDNLTAFRSPIVDALLAQARATGDPTQQQTRWASAEGIIAKTRVVVPIAQFRTQAVVSDRVEGWHPRVDGSVDWTAVTVAD